LFATPCIIFAGGKSSRMGEDKALLPFSTFDTLTEYQFSKLSKIFTNVYISAKSKENFSLHLQKYVIEDVESETSAPTIGFVSFFKHLEGEKFFVLSVDTPFVGEDEVRKLLSFSEQYDAVIAQTEKKHFMCGVYSRSLEQEFKNMLESDRHQLGRLLKSVETKYVTFDDESTFMNLNEPSEYQEALLKVENA